MYIYVFTATFNCIKHHFLYNKSEFGDGQNLLIQVATTAKNPKSVLSASYAFFSTPKRQSFSAKVTTKARISKYQEMILRSLDWCVCVSHYCSTFMWACFFLKYFFIVSSDTLLESPDVKLPERKQSHKRDFQLGSLSPLCINLKEESDMTLPVGSAQRGVLSADHHPI